VIATFAHPRYELYGAGTMFDGEKALRGFPSPTRPTRSLRPAPGRNTALVGQRGMLNPSLRFAHVTRIWMKYRRFRLEAARLLDSKILRELFHMKNMVERQFFVPAAAPARFAAAHVDLEIG
jgi:hypothetical protein